MIFKKLRYLYYRVYIWQLHHFGQVNAPEGPALVAVFILILVNIFTCLNIVNIFTGIDIILLVPDPIYDSVITLALLLTSFIIYKFKLWNKVVKEFSSETKKEKLKGTLFIWSYTLGSFAIVIYTTYLGKQARDAGYPVVKYLHHLFLN